MSQHHMKITSGSTPPGGAPFYITLSIYDGVGTKTYDTQETFKEALLEFTQTTPESFVNTLEMLRSNEKGWIIVEARLTGAGRKAFGVKDDE